MPEIKLGDAEGLKAWATMLTNNQDAYVVPEVTMAKNTIVQRKFLARF